MPSRLATIALPLFAPADRTDRYGKALSAGADAVIFDLEDAVAPSAKSYARQCLFDARAMLADAPCPVLVRVNAAGAPDHEADVRLARDLPLSAVLLAKAETAVSVRSVASLTGAPVVALIETARGLAEARAIAAAGARLAFGSIDFAADLGCAHAREALLLARLELVLASRLGGAAPPWDGVTTAVKDAETVRADAAYAASLGFGGKLLIHPAQIAAAADGLQPGEDEIRCATCVMEASAAGGAVAIDGAMIDAPVRLRADQILRRAAAGKEVRP